MLFALRAQWRNVTHGFWFVPGLVVGGFALLGFALLWVDRNAGTGGIQFLFSGSGPAARTVLSTIAASLITVAGLALSITIVALQLVSSQFSPRATRELLGDRGNQLSAGAFVGIFAYCLIVLRAVRDEQGEVAGFVPSLAVSAAILLGIGGLGILLSFIHHMAQSIKLPSIAGRIGRGTLAAAETLYPEPFGRAHGERADLEAARWPAAGTPVRAARAGYVQQVRLDELVRRLDRPGTRLQVCVRPGDFVTERRRVAVVHPALGDGEEEVAERVRAGVVVDDERDIGQDVAFGIQQLGDIALRAVSPSVNDPSTAITCIGYLAACLERLAERPFPAEVRAFDDDVLVAAPTHTFAEYVEQAFGQLVRHAQDVGVAEAALDGLARVAAAAAECDQARHFPPLADMTERLEETALSIPRGNAERGRIEAAAGRARSVLELDRTAAA